MSIFLAIAGTWCITDGWFSMSLYWKDPKQTFWHDHYIRVIRILFGIGIIFCAIKIG